MNITAEDLQQISLRLGMLEIDKTVLLRENRELVAALVVAEARLEEVGNPGGLVTDPAKPVKRTKK